VIGGVTKAPYAVYVRCAAAVKESIPVDYDGVILSLTYAGMNRSVTDLVEKNCLGGGSTAADSIRRSRSLATALDTRA